MEMLFTGHFDSLCYAKAREFSAFSPSEFLMSDLYINLAPFALPCEAGEKEIHEPSFVE